MVHPCLSRKWWTGSVCVECGGSGGLEQTKLVGFPTNILSPWFSYFYLGRWMAGFSVIYISIAIGLYSLDFGDTSLVYANIVNLLARVVYATHFISSYFGSRYAGDLLRWRDVVPTLRIIILSMLSSFIIHYHGHKQDISGTVKANNRIALLNISVVTHIGLGSLLALICVITWWMSSGRLLVKSGRAKME
jgi:oligosaccharide translocation protein RFT1